MAERISDATLTPPPVQVVPPVETQTEESLPPQAGGRVLKNVLFHALNIGSTFLMLTFGSILTARYLGIERMGQYSLLTTISNTLISVGTLGLVDATSRFVAQYMAEKNQGRLLGFIRLTLLVELVICLVAALAMYAFAAPLSGVFGLNGEAHYLILTGLVAAPAMFGSTFTSILAGLQRYDLIAIVKIVTTLPLLALIIMVFQLHLGITGLLGVNILVNFVTLLVWIVLLFRLMPILKPGYLPRSEIWRVVKFSAGLMMIALLYMVVWQRSEVFFLSTFRTAREVGLYAIAFVLSSFFTTLIINVLHVLIPAFTDLVSKGDVKGMARLFHTSVRVTAILSTPLAMGGILLTSQMLSIVYGGEYVDATTALRVLFVATLASTIAAGGDHAITSTTPRISIFMGVMLGLGLLSVTLDFLIIPTYGLVGAAICNTTVQLIAPLVYNQVLRRMHGFGYPVGPLSRIMGIGLVSLLLAFGVKLGIGGWLGPVVAGVVFAIAYLVGLVWLRALYLEDLEMFMKLVYRLPKRARLALLPALQYLSGRLKPEPPIDETKLKYRAVAMKARQENSLH